jgi:hypothetical protein
MDFVSLSCAAERRSSSAGFDAAVSLGEAGGDDFLALPLSDLAGRSLLTIVSSRSSEVRHTLA